MWKGRSSDRDRRKQVKSENKATFFRPLVPFEIEFMTIRIVSLVNDLILKVWKD